MPHNCSPRSTSARASSDVILKRSQEPGARGQEPGARSLEPGARSQEPGARSQESGARSQESGVIAAPPGPPPARTSCHRPPAHSTEERNQGLWKFSTKKGYEQRKIGLVLKVVFWVRVSWLPCYKYFTRILLL